MLGNRDPIIYYFISELATVQLYDDSVGCTSWEWKIGSTVASTEQHPIIDLRPTGVYSGEYIAYSLNSGYFPVTLTASDGSQTNNKTRDIVVVYIDL
jgi:hypothetical protein